ARDPADRSGDRRDRNRGSYTDRSGPRDEENGAPSDRRREPRPVDLSASHGRSATRPHAETEGREAGEFIEVLGDPLVRLCVPHVRDPLVDRVEVEIGGSPDHLASTVADRVRQNVQACDLSVVELYEDLLAGHGGDHTI